MPAIVTPTNHNAHNGSVVAAMGVILAPIIGGYYLAEYTLAQILTWGYGYLSRTEIKVLIGGLLTKLLDIVLDDGWEGLHLKQVLIDWLYVKTGLEIETFDKEGMKKAAGKLLADKINLQYGTNFTAFYPPENIIEQIRNEIQIEITEALG